MAWFGFIYNRLSNGRYLSQIAVLSVFAWGFFGVSALANGKPEDAILAAVNSIRFDQGLSSLTLQTQLNQAASNHSKYMSSDVSYVDHVESNSSSPYYSGQFPGDRLAAAGFKSFSTLYEDLEMGTPYFDSVAQLFASPYHRYAFLDPSVSGMGVGFSVLPSSEDYAAAPLVTMEFVSQNIQGSTPVVSPAPLQTGVPVSWADYESPDPLRFYNLNMQNATIGYPIMVFFPPTQSGENVLAYHIHSMQLQDSAGNVVPAYLNTTDNGDSEAVAGPILLPKNPLNYGATYTVSVSGTYSLQPTTGSAYQLPYHKTWTFTTVSKESKKVGIHLVVNGTLVDLDAGGQVQNGRVLLPLQQITEMLGLHMLWDSNTNIAYIYKDNRILTIQPDHNTLTIGRETSPVTIESQLQGGQPLVSVRSVAQAFGDSVNWEERTQTVFVSSQ